jgi:hypothetical protein
VVAPSSPPQVLVVGIAFYMVYIPFDVGRNPRPPPPLHPLRTPSRSTPVGFLLHDEFATPWVRKFWEAVVQLFNWLFLLDMAVCFRTAVIDDGIFLCGTREMATHYLRGWFTLDVMANFTTVAELAQGGMGLSAVFKNVRMVKIFRIIKLVRMPKLVSSLGTHLPHLFSFGGTGSSGAHAKLSVLLKAFVLLVAVAHLCACGLQYLVPTTVEDETELAASGTYTESWALSYFGDCHQDMPIESKYAGTGVLQRSLTTETACARAYVWGEGTFAGPRMALLPNGSLNGSPNGFPNGFPNGSLQLPSTGPL